MAMALISVYVTMGISCNTQLWVTRQDVAQEMERN